GWDAKLRIDSTQFDKNIKESTKQIKSIQQQGKQADAAIGKFAGGLLKAVPALAAVGSASAAFNRTLEINQILGDDVRRAMDGAKGAVDSFFLSLSTGSFDGFIRKMGQTIEAAKELYNSLDNLATFRIYENADMAELNTQKAKYNGILRNARSVDVNGNKIYSEEQIREAEKGLEEVNKKIKDTLLQERKLVDTAAQDIIQKVMAATGAGYGEAEKMLTDYRNAAEVQQRIAKLFAENTHEVRTATANQYGGTMTTTTTVWDNEAAKQEYQSLKALLALASDGQEVLGAYSQKRVEAAQISQQILQNEANQIRLEGRANQAYKGSADAVDELNEKLNENPLISADKTATNQIVTTLEQLPNKIAISSDFATPLEVLNSQLEQMRANAEAIGTAWNDNATAIGAIGGVVAEVGGLLDGNAAKITTWAASVIDSVGEVVAKYGAL
ncbi:MAG: hypothetical protein MJ053_07540, partial [Elusimicrobiaceae bacterium]|nr:hypothetical protein [Elusimicrobiaceae bacterium]